MFTRELWTPVCPCFRKEDHISCFVSGMKRSAFHIQASRVSILAATDPISAQNVRTDKTCSLHYHECGADQDDSWLCEAMNTADPLKGNFCRET